MAIELSALTLQSPRYPEETPFWPCALFLHGEEIVAALFVDEGDAGGGYDVDEQGVVGDEPIEPQDFATGWCLQILGTESPSPEDPRRQAPDLDVFGPDVPLGEVMELATRAIERSAQVLGLSYEESRARLLWSPVDGWPDA